MNLVTSRPCILNFFLIILEYLFPGLKMTFIAKEIYVYVKRLNSEYCPVALLERYISMCNIDLSSSVALFCPVRLYLSPPILTSYMELKLSYQM